MSANERHENIEGHFPIFYTSKEDGTCEHCVCQGYMADCGDACDGNGIPMSGDTIEQLANDLETL